MRNIAVVAGMALIGLTVIMWVAWPEGHSSAVEESTPRTTIGDTAQSDTAQGHTAQRNTAQDDPARAPTSARESMPTNAPITVAANASASIPTSAPDREIANAGTRAKGRCQTECDQDNGQCNSEARQSRQVCSKQAANGGNSAFSGRPEAFDYYCGYFDIAQCGNRGCAARFAQRYAECVQVMRGNVISQRFDCMRAQDEAQSLCREELRDCRAQCD